MHRHEAKPLIPFPISALQSPLLNTNDTPNEKSTPACSSLLSHSTDRNTKRKARAREPERHVAMGKRRRRGWRSRIHGRHLEDRPVVRHHGPVLPPSRRGELVLGAALDVAIVHLAGRRPIRTRRISETPPAGALITRGRRSKIGVAAEIGSNRNGRGFTTESALAQWRTRERKKRERETSWNGLIELQEKEIVGVRKGETQRKDG